ncbi:MAG: sodium-dependent transporter [Parvularcula sp.]
MAVSGGGNQEHWSGQFAFVLAAVGSAVGLGNLVRFPYVAGDSGGGAFVLVYLMCIVFIGLPVLVAELMIGRRGGGSAIAAVAHLAQKEGRSRAWAIFPALGAVACFLILSYYSVLAGWVFHFVNFSVADLARNIGENGFAAFSANGFADLTDEQISGELGQLVSNPARMLTMHAVFMGITILIVSRGISGGIEVAAKFLMPIFFVLLLVTTAFSLINGDAGSAISFLFKPDFSQITGAVLLKAVGQAFFSLSLGSAMMITYGVYMERNQSIPAASGSVAFADTFVALIAGLALFPIIFASPLLTQNILEQDPGLGLLYQTVPMAFHNMPFGGVIAVGFFVMTLFAALTSSIALLEVSVAWFDGDVDVEPETRARRRLIGAFLIGGACFAVGVANALSQVPTSVADTFFNHWTPLAGIPLFEGETFLDVVDTISGDLLLPFGGVLTAVFAGWVISKSAAKEEIGFGSERSFAQWHFLVRFVAPLCVGIILIYGAIIAPWMASRAAGSEAAQVIEEMTQPDQ